VTHALCNVVSFILCVAPVYCIGCCPSCILGVALQSSRPEPNLQHLLKAGRSSSSTSQATILSSRRAADSSIAAEADAAADAGDGSSGSASLFSDRYGYAVLGGVNPEASQQEAGAQQPKLHPTRDFRHGEVYQPTVRGRAQGGLESSSWTSLLIGHVFPLLVPGMQWQRGTAVTVCRLLDAAAPYLWLERRSRACRGSCQLRVGLCLQHFVSPLVEPKPESW
jgi:hypothetical protein